MMCTRGSTCSRSAVRTPSRSSTPQHPSRTLAGWCIEEGENSGSIPDVRRSGTYLTSVVWTSFVPMTSTVSILISSGIPVTVSTTVRLTRGMEKGWHCTTGAGRTSPPSCAMCITGNRVEATSPHRFLTARRVPERCQPRPAGSYYWVFQDSYGWLKEGIHDYLSPQIYWMIDP
ncbi:MAG: hypothetical protein MZV64_49130 [Ignavibacteriales bacterium]|nr:hypothetical protein [Ignavibacteriales bacterium]